MPTQLNGRTIVYGSLYCSQPPLAKYSDASFWKPYVEIGGGEVSWAPSGGAVERRRQDPLVLSQQVVRELVEVADPADHRGRSDDLVAVRGELCDERRILRIALHEPVARVLVVRLDQRAVLAEVIETDDLVAGVEQLGHQVAVDEAGRAGDQDAQVRSS
jgi:hypothetical protein